jgi:hypothetical protein
MERFLYDLSMDKNTTLLSLLAFSLGLSMPMVLHAAAEDGEKLMTPNQQRRIVQVNQDLPKDVLDQPRDSHQVAALRQQLREAYSGYQQAVKQYGSGTPESRQAGHQVLEAQQALHKQFVKEEAIPALSQVPR